MQSDNVYIAVYEYLYSALMKEIAFLTYHA